MSKRVHSGPKSGRQGGRHSRMVTVRSATFSSYRITPWARWGSWEFRAPTRRRKRVGSGLGDARLITGWISPPRARSRKAMGISTDRLSRRSRSRGLVTHRRCAQGAGPQRSGRPVRKSPPPTMPTQNYADPHRLHRGRRELRESGYPPTERLPDPLFAPSPSPPARPRLLGGHGVCRTKTIELGSLLETHPSLFPTTPTRSTRRELPRGLPHR